MSPNLISHVGEYNFSTESREYVNWTTGKISDTYAAVKYCSG